MKLKKGSQSPVELALAKLAEVFGVGLPMIEQTPEIAVVDLTALVATIAQAIPDEYGDAIRVENESASYTKISLYPYMTRDIAIFVPTTVAQAELEKIIDTYAGALMIRRDLFDVFTKKLETGEEKTSYAFRIVFQSTERTLTDDEINAVMQKITEVMNGNAGWTVR